MQNSKIKRLFGITLVAVITAMIFGNMQGVETAVKSVEISTTQKTCTTIQGGKKIRLKVANPTGKIKWSTNKKSVATVSKKGVVTGKAAGKAVIKAVVGGRTIKCKVIVVDSETDDRVNKLEAKMMMSDGIMLYEHTVTNDSIDEVRSVYDKALAYYEKCIVNGANADGLKAQKKELDTVAERISQYDRALEVVMTMKSVPWSARDNPLLLGGVYDFYNTLDPMQNYFYKIVLHGVSFGPFFGGPNGSANMLSMPNPENYKKSRCYWFMSFCGEYAGQEYIDNTQFLQENYTATIYYGSDKNLDENTEVMASADYEIVLAPAPEYNGQFTNMRGNPTTIQEVRLID